MASASPQSRNRRYSVKPDTHLLFVFNLPIYLCFDPPLLAIFCGYAESGPVMEWNKLTWLDQFLSPRRKVVSGFGLGVGASLIVLTVLFLNDSLKLPVLSPLFQGYNITRPLSLSTSSSSTSTHVDASIVGAATSELQSPVDLRQGVVEGTVLNKTLEANVSGVAEQGSYLEETHLGKLVGEDKNGSLGGVGLGRVEDATNESVADEENPSEKTHLGRGTFAANMTAQYITGENFVENYSSDGNHSVNVNGSAGNRPHLGELGGEKSNLETNFAGKHRNFDESCDIFDGRWVRDDTKPYYPAGSCPYIDRDSNCKMNGRPDDGFVKWKWQPNGCDMPSLNATDFLERLRGNRLVFVGDSLNRNMWESLVCILRQSVRNKKRVHEISGRREFKKKGVYAFRFEDYSCSIDFIVAPFLVRELVHKNRSGTFETLRLDLMDRTTSLYRDADVIVFNTGHWWTHEKTSKGENYYQEGNYVHPKLKALEAYKRALTTWARWIDKNVNRNKTQVFFRGYSATHFGGGQWNSGGQCHKEVEPILNDTYLAKYTSKYSSKMRVLEYVLQGVKTPVKYLNITKLTYDRKDGHPSIYRMTYKTVKEKNAAESSQDCSHWCLPGVPDTWNELLYASLLQSGRGSWRN